MKPYNHTIMYRILFILMLLLPSVSFGQKEKMSALVRKAWLEHTAAMRSKGGKGTESRKIITAFLKTSSGEAPDGCEVLAGFPGGLYVVAVPAGMLGQLAARREVIRIEAGLPRSATNDTAAVMTRQELVWDMPRQEPPVPRGYTGRGVVVGVMDIGFDLTHPTFLSSDGTSLRIKALWDQLDRTEDGEPHTLAVGRQYSGREALMRKARSTDADILCHGTHTSGSAAGSGWDGTRVTPFMGMAPDADICLVANYTTDNMSIVPEEERYRYTSATDVLGFKYIFDHAASAGKPCVASFSEGGRMGFGDDDILLQEALAALQGEGRIIVASAGNEALFGTYIHKPAGMPAAGAFILPAAQPCYTFRSSGPMALRLTFYPADGGEPLVKDVLSAEICACEDSCLTDTVCLGGIAFQILAAAYPSAYNGGETAVELVLSRTDGGQVGRDVPVSMTLTGEDNDIEAYSLGGYFTANDLDRSLSSAEKTHNILSPGGLEGIICVGATNARDGYLNHAGTWQDYRYGKAGERAAYSSTGPALPGLVKPDICAPGTYVKSALSSVFIAAGGDLRTCTETFSLDGRTYGWAAFTGTSMATPIVSGIIATWLEACPSLTAERVMDILSHTAAQVPADGTASAADASPEGYLPYGEPRIKNVLCGYGTIDAYAGLQYILEGNVTGISEIPGGTRQNGSRKTGRKGVFDLHGRRIISPVPGRMYVIDGKLTVL
ncbi:MAG: S8 family serine peptidase [Bacteroidales bacterium]|nr:S8 family serine peptidase [Bacteroidales bacterium]MCM1146672.1 S8 family serine peptidase [Bacteroidales bacterium]MCM1206062.1 S8 family serine peptidase [Bacillota bacterium]MCM1511035.1 S8 family serine peptidase [Clostridium sp.]